MIKQIRVPRRLLALVVAASIVVSLFLVFKSMESQSDKIQGIIPNKESGNGNDPGGESKVQSPPGPHKLREFPKESRPGDKMTVVSANTLFKYSSAQDYFRKIENRTGQFGSKRETDTQRALARLKDHKCPHIVRPPSGRISYHHQYLQLYTNERYYIYLYSAYYDDRPYTGLVPVIRILVVSSTLMSSVYCLAWYDGMDNPVQILIQHSKNGIGHTIDGKKHEQYFFTCQLPVAYPRPTHVSVVARVCEQPRTYLPVYHPIKSAWTHEFGVCGPTLYGNIDIFRLVEWIETYRHFGVTEFTMYVTTVNGSRLSKEVMDALVYYEDQGIVDLHYMPPPREINNNDNIQVASMAVLNDCIYRNMYRYRYAIVVDLDEFIFPRLNKTYGEMLQRIDKELKITEPPPSYSMRNAYFWTSCGAPGTQPEFDRFQALKYFRRVKESDFLFLPKSFINPRTCLSVYNHYCWIRFPQVKSPWTIDVPAHIALSHHYRKFRRREDTCDQFARNAIRDETALKYKEVLMNKINTTLSKIRTA